ncbi:MAG: hypothetical protein BA865_14120 [Desulfobacterales bacterium S5133MH4]|nr:MAG: hypothetical protein BA865_14120 [Desulfobacterales bacterium S5133MH4]
MLTASHWLGPLVLPALFAVLIDARITDWKKISKTSEMPLKTDLDPDVNFLNQHRDILLSKALYPVSW